MGRNVISRIGHTGKVGRTEKLERLGKLGSLLCVSLPIILECVSPGLAQDLHPDGLQLDVSQSQIPQSQVSQSQIPQSQIPQSQIPQSQVSQSQVSQSQVPQSQVPQSQIPQSQIPQSQVPQSQVSQSQIPQSQVQPTPEPIPSGETQTIEDDRGDTTDSDALFERIFGRPRTLQSQQVIVPYLINQQPQGQVLVNLELGTQTPVRWLAAEFLETLARFIRPDLLTLLHVAVDENGFLTLQALQNQGLEASFNAQTLELLINIPPEQRSLNILDTETTGIPPEWRTALRPDAFSAYANLRGGMDWIWEDSQADSLGRQPLNLQVDGAVNLFNWVLEGRATFEELQDPSWVRSDIRLVRDLPSAALRIVAGDLSIPIRGYQTALPMGGITVARNFGLQPYVITRPISNFEFFLETPSRVEVFINGRLDRTLNLPAGPQDIRDLSLGTGANAVELVITDGVGQVQRLNFATALAGGLLAPGIQQFAYSLGVPSIDLGGLRSYETQFLILTASHRLGITKQLTAGPYLQANFEQQLLGLEGIWATSLGNWGLDLATTHTPNVGMDFAGILRYDRSQSGPNNPSNRSISVELEYRGKNFVPMKRSSGSLPNLSSSQFSNPFFDLEPNNEVAYNLNVNYSQKLFAEIQGNLNAQYRWGRSSRANDYNFSLGLSRSLRRGLNLSVRLSYLQPNTGPAEQQIFSTLSLSVPQRRQSFTLSTDITNQSRSTQRFNWFNSSARTIGGLNRQINITQSPTDYQTSLRLSRRGFLGEFDFTQDSTFPSARSATSQQRSRLNFGTGLALAGGRLAVTRPINDSFVIITRHPAIRRYPVEINGNSTSGPAALAHRFGAGVLSNLQPYQLSRVEMSSPDLPMGYSLGQSVYNLVPTYKSGRLIQVGTGAVVFGRGILVNAQGEPIALQGGEVSLRSGNQTRPIPFFTNRVGRFVLEGLQPGRYQLTLFSQPRSTLEFEIPEGSEGLVDLGQLQMPPY